MASFSTVLVFNTPEDGAEIAAGHQECFLVGAGFAPQQIRKEFTLFTVSEGSATEADLYVMLLWMWNQISEKVSLSFLFPKHPLGACRGRQSASPGDAVEASQEVIVYSCRLS